MNISEVKMNFIRVSEIVRNTGKAKKLLMSNWDVDKEIQINKCARIYIITSNGEIKKIGASNCKSGIKGTMSFYESANTGGPSIRSFGVQKMILSEIGKGNKVEVYVSFTQNIEIVVQSLLKERKMTVSISANDIEYVCKNDYYDLHGKYPDWNYQENNEPWPNEIQKAFDEHQTAYRKRIQRKNR